MKAEHAATLLAAAMCLLCMHGAHAVTKSVDLTTLILTVPGWVGYDHAETMLRGYGAPYEIKQLNASQTLNVLNVTQMLTHASGSGKYGFIIVTPANVINIFGGVLSLDQVNQLYAYQEAFSVRLALEGPYVPTVGTDIAGGPAGLGVQLVDTTIVPPDVKGALSVTAPLTTSGIKPGGPVDLAGLYTTPVTITDNNRSRSVISVTSPPQFAGSTAAVTTRFPSGREQFTNFFPCAAFSSDCVLVAHLYYAWGMHGILPGARDALFSIQVDDLFLSTEEPFNSTAAYRMTAADSQALASFAANVPSLPAGSSFKVEIVYNNGGYIEQTQPEPFYSLWSDIEPADVPQTFQKVPGTGSNLMPTDPNVSWWNPALWKSNDPLFREIAYGASGLQFYLGHHTFTHENLNNVTYYDALQQIRLNQLAAQTWNSTNGKFNRFSQSAMVTPAISGLRNVDALRALMDAGITAAVGDSSWPHLRNQANPWLAQILSQTANQTVDGFMIIPRSPTEVYYDVSTEAVEAQLYNWFYCCNSTANANCPTASCEAGKPFSKPSVWTDILAREQARVMRLMLALRPDGHMFHQANCRTDAGGPTKQSLLRQWITAIVAGYTQRVTWPLTSLKLDDQQTFHKKRIVREACGLKYTLEFDAASKAASALIITSSSGGCDAPVMIASTAVTGANPRPRALGLEPLLYTATVAAGGSKKLTFGNGISWS